MNKKLILLLLAVLAMLLCAGTAMAETRYCEKCKADVTVHYTNQGNYHLVTNTCQHTNPTEEGHKYSAATCTSAARCVCGATTGEPLAHEYGEYSVQSEATCTEDRVEVRTCKNCPAQDTRTVEKTATGHSWSLSSESWAEDNSSCTAYLVCQNDATHTTTATSTNVDILVNAEATCTEKGKVTYYAYFDSASFGRDYLTKTVDIPALGHDYELTSTKNGDKTYTCTRCGDTYTKKHSHWYGEWSPNGDGTHTANCKHCDRAATIDCETFEYAFANENGEASAFSFCPVCGEMNDGTRLEIVEDAEAEGKNLPKGEVIVRSNGEFISVGFEFFGSLTQPTEDVTICVPAELLNGCTLNVYAADGTETALEYTVEDEVATFTLNFGETPVVLIRMA